MAFRTTLSLGGKEFDVLDCDYKLERDANGKDRPASDIYGGKVRVHVESTEDTSILEHYGVPVQADFGKRCLQEGRRGGENEEADAGKRLHRFLRGIHRRGGIQAHDFYLRRLGAGIENRRRSIRTEPARQLKEKRCR